MDDQVEHRFHGHSPFLKLQTSAHLLVPQWSTESIYGLTGAMLAAIGASVTYECLNEYLLYLKRHARHSQSSSECFGVPVITCKQKLGQTVIQIMRVIFGYFLMFCVMTMNVWLLISVVLGAFVGYGVGKPIVANGIRDAVTSHGYESATVKISRFPNRRSEISRSWRYQAISDAQMQFDIHREQFPKDQANLQIDENKDTKGGDIIWVRRESEVISSDLAPDRTGDADQSADQSPSASNFDSLNSHRSDSMRSSSRFKSTSKVINDSFRPNKSDYQIIKHASTSSGFTQESPKTIPRHQSKVSVASNKLGRSSSASLGRFKPVSKQIHRHRSFNENTE